MYTNNQNYRNYLNYPTSINNSSYYNSDERFLLAPFLLGGLAGTALGYGIAGNNQNSQTYYPVYPVYPAYQTYPMYHTYTTSNNYYY